MRPNIRGRWFVYLLSVLGPSASAGQTLDTVQRFNGGDGARPWGQLVRGRDGNYFGTTQNGGGQDAGTVFKITPDGKLSTLYRFCSQIQNQVCTDGESPAAGLTQATDGTLYGTTYYGGAGNPPGGGTVFRISPDGALTTIYRFCSEPNCSDGAAPMGSLYQGTDGAFYGTTFHGGNANAGTLFRITPGGALRTMYSFCSRTGCADGSGPQGSLIEASNGALYGTTVTGGQYEGGTVFTISLTGGELTTLYSFCYSGDCTGGGMLFSGVVQARDGNFYGATYYNTLGGTVFKLTSGGVLTTVYTFCSEANCSDGQYPRQLTLGSDGNIYGTTLGGGANDGGTAFRLTLDGTLTTLYNFCADGGCTDGRGPLGGLIRSADGSLYGTTLYGGSDKICKEGCGTVYRLAP